MSEVKYPEEVLDSREDDGTMRDSLDSFRSAIIGHKIVSVDAGGYIITLDDGHKVQLVSNQDCCAFTYIKEFLLHPELVNHAILGVGTTDDYQTWHIYADLGDILELTVDWSAGNPFYYGYGFDIQVEDIKA